MNIVHFDLNDGHCFPLSLPHYAVQKHIPSLILLRISKGDQNIPKRERARMQPPSLPPVTTLPHRQHADLRWLIDSAA